MLRGLDLSAAPGVLAILGVNAAGKTTLLQTLATLKPFTAENATLAGYDLRLSKDRSLARRHLGFRPQACDFPRTFTTWDLVMYMAWLRRLPKRERPQAASDTPAAVDLLDHAGQRLAKLVGWHATTCLSRPGNRASAPGFASG